MNRQAPGDPIAVMPRPERRKWRQAERRAVREHNTRQLATLRNLAAAAGELTPGRPSSADVSGPHRTGLYRCAAG
jgi:hypothetical protein